MIIAIIQARMGSTRLSGKVLRNIKDNPVLWHVYNRVSKSKLIDKIIIATSNADDDKNIFDFCLNNNISCFSGSEEDVLERYYEAALSFNANENDTIVRLTADCPLHDAEIIDKVIRVYLENDFDYVSNNFQYTYPDGLDTEVFSFKALKEAFFNAKLASEREHVTPYIKNNNSFRTFNVTADKEYPSIRLTLDYPEDFEMIEAVYKGFENNDFSFQEVVEYLEKNPEIIKINSSFEINEGYHKSLLEDRVIK